MDNLYDAKMAHTQGKPIIKKSYILFYIIKNIFKTNLIYYLILYEVSLHHIVTFSPCHDLYIAPPPIFEAAKCKSTCLLIIENKKIILFGSDSF